MRRIVLLLTIVAAIAEMMTVSGTPAGAQEQQESGGIDIADCAASGGMVSIDPDTGDFICVPRPSGPGEEPPEPPQPGPDPVITINTPVDGVVYVQDQQVTADFNCAPGGSDIGMNSCSAFNDSVFRVNTVRSNIDPPSGQTTRPPSSPIKLDTTTVGTHTFYVAAENSLQHTTTLTHTYEVVPPCARSADGVEVKGGSKLPATGGIKPLAGGGVVVGSVLILGAAMMISRRISRR